MDGLDGRFFTKTKESSEYDENNGESYSNTTYMTTQNSLILLSKNKNPLFAFQIIDSNLCQRDGAIKSTFMPFNGVNDELHKFQHIFEFNDGQLDAKIAFVMTNLTSKKLKVNLMWSNNGKRLNEINVISPFASTIIKSDYGNENREIILSRFMNAEGQPVTVEEDESKQPNGTKICLNVFTEIGDCEMEEEFKGATWTIQEDIMIRQIIPSEKKIRKLKKPFEQDDYVNGECIKRMIWFAGGRYESGCYIPSTYKEKVMEGSAHPRPHSSFYSFGKKNGGKFRVNEDDLGTMVPVKQSYITSITGGERVSVQSCPVLAKFVMVPVAIIVGISIVYGVNELLPVILTGVSVSTK